MKWACWICAGLCSILALLHKDESKRDVYRIECIGWLILAEVVK